jgi:hypothetical protein
MVSVRLKERNLLFVHVPKTAGGSISRVLREEHDAVVHGVTDMTVAIPCVEQLQAQLNAPLSSFRTVTCVRNPWDWTVSGWLHVTRNLPAYETPPSFRDFVLGAWHGATSTQYPEKFSNPDAYVSYHTQITQWEHLCARGRFVEIDAVCRFEALSSDFFEAFGIGARLPHVNRSKRALYATYYDDETRLVVADRNKPLIDRFGYVFGVGPSR